MKKSLIAFGLCIITSTTFAAIHELAANVISIKKPTVSKAELKNHETAVYMDIINSGTRTHELIAATSPIADQTQLHKTTHAHHHTRMKQVPDILLKSHHDKRLHKGGKHMMLIGLKADLIHNKTIPITLIFKDGSWIQVGAKVQ